MLRNYFRIAWRNLIRRKGYSVINILGFALGIACAILIFTLVKYHLNFDHFHPSEDRIYRVYSELHEDQVSYSPGVPSPLPEIFRDDYTVAEKVARITMLSKKIISTTIDQKFEEEIVFAEPAFFDIFNFPLLRGDKKTMLADPNAAVITERMAKKYFGSADPIGKTLYLDDTLAFTVSGILKDLPASTDFRSEVYLPFQTLKNHSPSMARKWWFNVNEEFQVYLLLRPGVTPAAVDKQVLADISTRHYDKKMAQVFRFKLQALSDIHFNPDLNGIKLNGHVDKKNLWALMFIGFLLIVSTCINFINMSIAQAQGRSKEIGVRKVLGSLRGQLFSQFIIETALIAGIAMLLAFVIAQLALPSLNVLFGTQVEINIIHDPVLLIFLLLLLIIIVFISGGYPGLIIATSQPVLALKNTLSKKQMGGFSLRKGLVVTQFAISQLLIIGTIVIANQMRYTRQANLGFKQDAIVMLPVPDNHITTISTLRSQFSQIAGIEKVTFCADAPASENTPSTGVRFASRPEMENFSIFFKAGDDQYISTFGLKILAGRNIFASDTVREFLFNEETVKKLGLKSFKEALGQTAVINGKTGTVVGIVKNFHNQSLHGGIDPIYISTSDHHYHNCALKINIANLRPIMASLESTWKTVNPNYIYKYSFLDDRIAQFYKSDDMFFKLIQVFTIVSIIIGCFGLYGLISFMAARKTKEIGIRKALGASVENIVWLFGKEFLSMLFMAFMIAAPLAWWTMTKWLDTFAYRIGLGLGVFVLAILISLLIVTFTIGYRSIKAALTDPVKSLRSE
ncbi:putative permease [Chitinophaga polysaccharea]|uniref:Putative permease n=1 Tax=Chitinophaga polysaccharea TaxID=1293035 RepID=A0A561P9V9_9BACT|nr:ABC transporter permease [Chitinophaga polysaccharea]TWF34914.1 putative permease [Chitinophaga polysaccharea]